MCWICEVRKQEHPRCYECGEELCLNVEEDESLTKGFQVDVRFFCKPCLFSDEMAMI